MDLYLIWLVTMFCYFVPRFQAVVLVHFSNFSMDLYLILEVGINGPAFRAFIFKIRRFVDATNSVYPSQVEHVEYGKYCY